jgi:CheY-like chemotaxis protein
MAEFQRLRKLINQSIRQSAEESSMLLGQELTLQDTDFIATNKMTYFSDMEDSSFVMGVESREDYPGCFHMVFPLRDAIAMSGILLGIPPARISEKKTLLILEADDIDAFSEIANQIIGSFNSVFQPALPQKVHLKQLPPTKFIPQMDEVTEERPVPDGEYLLCRTKIELQGHEMDRIDILIPLKLANLFDPQEAAKTADEGGAIESANVRNNDCIPDGQRTDDAQSRSILIIEDNTEELEHIEKLLADSGFTTVTAALNTNIADLLEQQPVNAVVLGINKGNEREFSICNRIKVACDRYSLPIIMSAREWTRTGVLKAVKYGARGILIKPYNADELLEKLGKFLDAA